MCVEAPSSVSLYNTINKTYSLLPCSPSRTPAHIIAPSTAATCLHHTYIYAHISSPTNAINSPQLNEWYHTYISPPRNIIAYIHPIFFITPGIDHETYCTPHPVKPTKLYLPKVCRYVCSVYGFIELHFYHHKITQESFRDTNDLRL